MSLQFELLVAAADIAIAVLVATSLPSRCNLPISWLFN